MPAPTTLRRADWLVPALLMLLALAPSPAGVMRVVELAHGDPVTPENVRFFAMPLPVVLSVEAIRRRRFVAHGAWMMRAYAIGMGSGTQVFTHLPWFLLVGQPTEGPRAAMMGPGWVIKVVVAEWLIRRGRQRS